MCKSGGETFKRNGPIIPTFKKNRRLYNLQKVSLGIENMFQMSFNILNPMKMAKNGQNHGNSRYVSPPDFKGCLLVRWLFSNFSIGNLIISYEFFKGIHILCQKTKESSPIHKKAEDIGHWTEKCSLNCPNPSLFVQKWKTVKSGHLTIFLGSQHYIPT